MGKVVIDGVEFLFNKLYQNGSETDEIAADMFYENKLLTYVEMETVTIINFEAFGACSNLTTAIFKNLRVLGNSVFGGCNFKTIDISNVVSIGNLCFGVCVSLETITLNDEITEIDVGTFLNCRGLTSIHLPENLEKIGNQAFYGAQKLVITQLLKKVNTIGNFSFGNCSSLTSLKIGSEGYPVKIIGDNAFINCNNLTSLTIYTTGGQALTGAPWGAINATITYLSA